MSDFENAMYDLLISALVLRAGCRFEGGQVPEFLTSLMEALDAVEISAPSSLLEANSTITATVEKVLRGMD